MSHKCLLRAQVPGLHSVLSPRMERLILLCEEVPSKAPVGVLSRMSQSRAHCGVNQNFRNQDLIEIEAFCLRVVRSEIPGPMCKKHMGGIVFPQYKLEAYQGKEPARLYTGCEN